MKRIVVVAGCIALSGCTIVRSSHHGSPDGKASGPSEGATDAGPPTSDGSPGAPGNGPPGATGDSGSSGTADGGAGGNDVLSALDNTMPKYTTDQPRSVVRVDLFRDTSGVSAPSIQRLRTSRRLLPAVSAQYLVVAYAGDKIVSAMPVQFPKIATSASFEDDGTLVSEGIPVEVSSATVLLDADESVDGIALFDGAGAQTTLHSGKVPALSMAAPVASMKSPSAAGVGTIRQADTGDTVFTVLGPGDMASIPENSLTQTDPKGNIDEGQLVTPTNEQIAAFQKSLLALPPALASSVSRVGFAQWPAGSWTATHLGAWQLNGTVMWNVDLKQTRIDPTIAHETTHAFAAAMDDVAYGGDASKWPALGVQMARDAVSTVWLASGLTDTWQSLHATGVQAGVAGDYVGTDWQSLSNQQALPLGFASAYGASAPAEDLAEYVGTTLAPTLERPGICSAFTNAQELDLKVAVPYAKLVLLRAVGLIPAAAFDHCVNGLRAGSGDRGVYFKDSISFVGKATHSTDTQQGLYEVIAEGDAPYIFDMKLALPSGPLTNGYTPSALGLHRLSNAGSVLFAPGTTDSIFIYHSSPFRSRTSIGGLVLVLEDSLQHTQGVFFGIDFQSPTGTVTDRVPYGTYSF